MKFKLDENFGTRTINLFSAKDLDTETVLSEKLSGAPDEAIFEACKIEGRCLVTLDLDFTDVLRFPPQDSPGVVVIRVPGQITLKLLETLVSQFLSVLSQNDPTGKLWIVEPGRIRVHQDPA